MDGVRGAGYGGEPLQLEVEDEFACSGMLRGSLSTLHGTVERIFGVAFAIGAEDPAAHDSNGQIWLKLRGPSGDVEAAKLFVKGLVNQEEQQEVSYPGVLHCIFSGARGLFVDCLTKNTSAHIVVGSTGSLLISGLAEPVVRAYSLITDLVERCDGTQSRDRGPGESLDSRRAFKTLAEKWEDKHTLDLLVLPGSVKEILLDLVRESGLGSGAAPAPADGTAGAGPDEELEDVWVKPFAAAYALPEPSGTAGRWVEGLTASPEKDSEDSSSRSVSGGAARGRAEGSEGRLVRSPQEEEPGEEAEPGTKMKKARGEEEGPELQLSVGNKEFWLLLKFFTAMGYTEDVVKRVLARTGPREASQILDVVQQEQDRSDREEANGAGASSSQSERNRPCETEHREEEEMEVGGDEAAADEGATAGAAEEREEEEDGHEDDFVLGVVKKAAASCGYMEQEVAKLYGMLPDRSTHQLLLELQREAAALREAGPREAGPREMDDVVPEENGPGGGAYGGEAAREEAELSVPAEKRKSDDGGRAEAPHATASEFVKFRKPADSRAPHRAAAVLPEVKGPPTSTYPSCLNLPLANIQPSKQYDPTAYWSSPSTSKTPNQPTQRDVPKPKPRSSSVSKQAPLAPRLPVSARNDASPTRARERRGFAAAAAAAAAASSSVVVTGEQRFMEGLQMPFDLQLTDKPGDANVRTIVIDGSNVAMSHGLGHFFSCRGIALAVQHFWDRGHRHISALLPQWRQKSDPKIKEQHYLSELQKLGLLSYTPSREVQGKRISSYDDRLMLQLAQKTDGVIVTNDNLRDLSDESLVWRDIIKKRLLQYTFVGDHFMVPDDPLGRGGPHLDDFLRTEHRTPDPGNHSFAGAATTFPSSKPPRSQTELLNFRDRTPGGAPTNGAAGGGGAGGGGSRSKGRGHGKEWGPGHLLGVRADRSPEETAGLREQLCQVFPGQDSMVALVLQCHPEQTDMNVLSELILQQ